MVKKKSICTKKAPGAIGPYSQAIQVGEFVFISGQIPLEPVSMEIVDNDIDIQTHQVFKNIIAIIEEAGGEIEDIVKITIYLTDLDEFSKVNKVMSEYFESPFPARVTVEVSALPKGSLIEVDAIASLSNNCC